MFGIEMTVAARTGYLHRSPRVETCADEAICRDTLQSGADAEAIGANRRHDHAADGSSDGLRRRLKKIVQLGKFVALLRI